jgi:hypothetical protein
MSNHLLARLVVTVIFLVGFTLWPPKGFRAEFDRH